MTRSNTGARAAPDSNELQGSRQTPVRRCLAKIRGSDD